MKGLREAMTAKDPAEGAVLIRCAECGKDTGPAWVDPAYPLVPAVVHLPTGAHEYRWHERGVTESAGSPCPQGRTDYEACFAPFRYCPVKGCGRGEGDKQLPTEATQSDFEAGRRAATADIVAALRLQIEHHDPNASIATVIWRDAVHLAQRVGDGHRD